MAFNSGTVSSQEVADGESACPSPQVQVYDSSIDFNKTVQFALNGELLFSGIGFTGKSELHCSGNPRGPCEPNILLDPNPTTSVGERKSDGSKELLPFYRRLEINACNYTNMLRRWYDAYPTSKVHIIDSVRAPNPQGFYMYFGTLNRGSMLEIHHPFFDDSRPVPMRSVSKSFAVAVILALQDQGKLDIDRPAYIYVPSLGQQADMKSITLRDIMTHASGFVDSWEKLSAATDDPMMSLQDSVKIYARFGLTNKPKSQGKYANGPFQIIGAAAEAASGKSWNELWKELIADPLGMNGTYFYSDTLLNTSKVPRNPYISRKSLSNGRDLVKFVTMIANKGVSIEGRRIISESSSRNIAKWSGTFPLGTLEGRSVNISDPCYRNSQLNSTSKSFMRDLDYSSDGLSRKDVDWRKEYQAIGLSADESNQAQIFSQFGGYGLGVFVYYDEKCRKNVVANSAFSALWSIFDIDGDDPILGIYFGGINFRPLSSGDHGRAMILLAAEELRDHQAKMNIE